MYHPHLPPPKVRSIYRTAHVAGFTLIELLVVIAIIAVLAAIALGVYQRTTKNSQQVASVARLRTLGMAALLWSNDNDGWSPPAAWYAGPRSTSGKGKSILAPYGTIDRAIDKNGFETFTCPAADLRLVARGYILYGINATLATPCDAQGMPEFGSGHIYFWDRGVTKLISVSNPASRVFFMATGLNANDDNPSAVQSPSTQRSYLAHHNTNAGSNTTRRFGGKASIFWMDGHTSLEPEDYMQAVRGTNGTYKSPQDSGKYFTK